jgi:hypothetical protein
MLGCFVIIEHVIARGYGLFCYASAATYRLHIFKKNRKAPVDSTDRVS